MEHTNFIFSWYCFPSSHCEDGSECGSNLIANNWMSSIPTSRVLNTYSSSFFSTLLLPPFLSVYASFSFTILCIFSIAFSALILLQTPKLWKNTTSYSKRKQLVTITLCIFVLQLPTHLFFGAACCILINTWNYHSPL
jgi:hypothetical protein